MTRAQALDEAVAGVELARRYVDEVEFSAEDASRTTPDFLEAMAIAVVEAGADTFNIPDTVGYALPEEFAELVGRVVRAVGERAVVSVHCHDDLGLAVANSLAAVEAGARQVECTINGIGERAGNCALEEVVMALRVRHDRLPFDIAIRTDRLFSASEMLSAIVGFTPQPNKAVVGRNAFAHEAGIHQDGVIKHRSTYEIMDPATVGVPEGRLVLGKHSGRHALQRRCEALGFALDADQLERLYRAFVAFADRKKGVVDDEIVTLIQHGTGDEQPRPEVQRP
jgi:2-isopropylmalate synthase